MEEEEEFDLEQEGGAEERQRAVVRGSLQLALGGRESGGRRAEFSSCGSRAEDRRRIGPTRNNHTLTHLKQNVQNNLPITSRQSPRQRSHFAIFIPSPSTPTTGTLINVVGAPMTGFYHEFKRGYNPEKDSLDPYESHALVKVRDSHIFDLPEDVRRTDNEPKGDMERAGVQIPAPRASENFLAPINGTTNRRCQEWTTDYIRLLVSKGYIDGEAIDIVQSKRDPPSGLQPTASGLC
ncbi:hypothetical protein BDV19DRAFT_387918 [Aspergillus venezuelensis]